MGLYKRGDIWHYQGKGPDGERLRCSTECRSRKAADEWERQLFEGYGRGETPGSRQVTYAHMREALIRDYRLNDKRSIKDVIQTRLEKHLDPYFRGMRAMDISANRIAKYKDLRRAEGYSKASINRELSALKRMFTLAKRDHGIAAPYIEMFSERDAIRQVELPRGNFLAIQRNLPERLRDPVEFLYWTGVRKNAMVTLEWRSVQAGSLIIRAEHSKNGEPVSIPLAGELAAIIERARQNQRLDCPLVFHENGRSLGNFKKAWKGAQLRAGFYRMVEGQKQPLYWIHDLCKAGITNMIEAGMDPKKVSERSGRKTRSTIDRYHIVRHTAEDSERLDAYVKSLSTKSSVSVLHPATVSKLCHTQTKTDRNGPQASGTDG